MMNLRPHKTEHRIRIMRRSRTSRRDIRLKVLLFSCALLLGLVISLIPALRPSFSERERRELTKFPEFSVETLKSGEYFRGIESWFSDTFPGRDFFLELNKQITSLYGVRNVEIHGEIISGDVIPDKPFTGG